MVFFQIQLVPFDILNINDTLSINAGTCNKILWKIDHQNWLKFLYSLTLFSWTSDMSLEFKSKPLFLDMNFNLKMPQILAYLDVFLGISKLIIHPFTITARQNCSFARQIYLVQINIHTQTLPAPVKKKFLDPNMTIIHLLKYHQTTCTCIYQSINFLQQKSSTTVISYSISGIS